MIIGKVFTFDAAHFLPDHPGKCAGMHGHTYRMEVRIRGQAKPNGMVLDFGDFDVMVQRAVLDRVDHKVLNDMFPNTRPTAENLVEVFADEIISALPLGLQLVSIRLYETADSFAEAWS